MLVIASRRGVLLRAAALARSCEVSEEDMAVLKAFIEGTIDLE